MPVCSSVFSFFFSWSDVTIPDLILGSIIHFELILVQEERIGSSFNIL
jgi:hypothetical protein